MPIWVRTQSKQGPFLCDGFKRTTTTNGKWEIWGFGGITHAVLGTYLSENRCIQIQDEIHGLIDCIAVNTQPNGVYQMPVE